MGWERLLHQGEFDLADTEGDGTEDSLEGWLSLVLTAWLSNSEADLAENIARLASSEISDVKTKLDAANRSRSSLGELQYLEGQLNAWETIAQKMTSLAESRTAMALRHRTKVVRSGTLPYSSGGDPLDLRKK